MPKRPPDPSFIHIDVIQRGKTIVVPSRDNGQYVRARAPRHGLYFRLGMNPQGIFVTANRLWEALDLVIDFDDESV